MMWVIVCELGVGGRVGVGVQCIGGVDVGIILLCGGIFLFVID